MVYIFRIIEHKIRQYLEGGRSILLLGPRQTGKTTLIKRFQAELVISLIDPRVRLRYERDPSLLRDEVEAIKEDHLNIPLVIIDEVQKVPSIMDVVQDLIDRGIAKFILTGSSARKLRRSHHINLLPGRVIVMHLDPLQLMEMNEKPILIMDLIIHGSLPNLFLTQSEEEREALLTSYVLTYLEEEIRLEAVVRNIAHFSKFLELAASESGNVVNFSKLSQEIGVANSTISSYYQILEDCLIAERIEPYAKSKTRKKLTKSAKYLIFDLGVRRVAANEGTRLPQSYLGRLFEQFIALEIIRRSRATAKRIKIHFWRDPDGPEVDWVLDVNGKLIPIEVKWTQSPTLEDAKYLALFLNEYDEASVGYIVCQTPRKMKLKDNIYAIPWQETGKLVDDVCVD